MKHPNTHHVARTGVATLFEPNSWPTVILSLHPYQWHYYGYYAQGMNENNRNFIKYWTVSNETLGSISHSNRHCDTITKINEINNYILYIILL